jgi:hypothetical protein
VHNHGISAYFKAWLTVWKRILPRDGMEFVKVFLHQNSFFMKSIIMALSATLLIGFSAEAQDTSRRNQQNNQRNNQSEMRRSDTSNMGRTKTYEERKDQKRKNKNANRQADSMRNGTKSNRP